MENIIVCPICDEELGDSIENLPDKCPICDTRKYEIIEEIKDQVNPENTPMMLGNKKSEVVEKPILKKTKKEPEEKFEEIISASAKDRDENLQEEIISVSTEKAIQPERENIEIDEEFIPIEKITKETIIAPMTSVGDEEVIIENIISEDSKDESFIDIDKGALFDESSEDIVFSPMDEEIVFDVTETAESSQDSSEKISFMETPQKVEETSFHETPQEAEKTIEEANDVIFEEASATEKTPPLQQGPTKSGASSLEVIPEKNEKGKWNVPAGDYLILYNDQKKIISYFRLNDAGSVIVGRSSERNSMSDIDLTSAWKHYYRPLYTGNEFKEKMSLVKGISRKHALIRYNKQEKQYILFHLSKKNHTTVQMPDGKKWQRAPHNRTPIPLVHKSTIVMGNHKQYILLRFKQVK